MKRSDDEPVTEEREIEMSNGAAMTALLNQQNELTAAYGEPVHVYTRQEAIEDGFLVDITETAQKGGVTVAVACTQTAFERCIYLSREDADLIRRSEVIRTGYLVDALYKAMRAGADTDRVLFTLTFSAVEKGQVVEHTEVLEAVIGPGDEGEPVITIDLADDE